MVSVHLLATETPIGNITGIGTLGLSNTVGSPLGFTSTAMLLEKILSNLIGALTIVASLWFIYQILLSALSWISSNGDKQNIQTAQKRLTNSFLGLLVAVAAYSVTALIGRILGMPNIFDVAFTIAGLHP
jgi:branched-subunit amino acid transport protein AzlD